MTATAPLRPATAQECTYLERGRRCHQQAAGILDANYGTGLPDFTGGYHEPGTPWPMCERHLRPEFHPPDLHGRLKRWAAEPGVES